MIMSFRIHDLSHPGFIMRVQFFSDERLILLFSPRYPNEFDHTYTYVCIVLIYNIIFSTVWIFGGVDRWWNLPHFCHHCSSSFILCPKFLASQKEIFPKPYAYQWTDHGNSLFTQLCMKLSGHRVLHVDELACLLELEFEHYSQKKLRQQRAHRKSHNMRMQLEITSQKRGNYFWKNTFGK